MEKKYPIPVIVLILILIASGVWWLNAGNKKDSTTVVSEASSAPINTLSNEELKTQVDETLDVLMRIHNVSVIDKTTSNPESVIIDELTESMNDLNKLRGLTYRTEALLKSGNQIIATTGLVLDTSTKILIKIYDSWIQYLRGVDIYNVDVSEFQYQLALFQSSTHDAYLTLVENALMLPMVTVEFAEEEGGENTVNEELKKHFLTKIDEKFTDIFAEDDAFYRETKNRYAVAILVRQYKDFFNEK